MDGRDAFKVGFIARCVEAGLGPEEMLGAVKEAREKLAVLSTIAGKTMDIGKSVAEAALSWGIPLAIAAPPVVGGLGGYGLAKATDVDPTDVADIKDKEVLDEYKRQSARLRRQRAVRDYQKARRATGRMF